MGIKCMRSNGMIYTGVVSVTFRKLSPKEIVELASKAGLDGIEWGGDVHVPHGDTACAREVYKMTNESGLKVASYGSYYRLGGKKEGAQTFESVLETAVELKVPVIRVWAGNIASADADENWWQSVIEESFKIASLAQKENIKLAYEYHGNSLTDTSASALRLLKGVNHNNMRSYWQPLSGDTNENINNIKDILPWLENIHVYNIVSHEKRPLAEGKNEWLKYLSLVKELKEDRYAMLEFVMDNEPEQFLRDSATLKELILETVI